MDVQNRHKNFKRTLFVTSSHHCLTRNGGFVAAAKAGKCRGKHFFLTHALFKASKQLGRRRPGLCNSEWNNNGLNHTAAARSILRRLVTPYDLRGNCIRRWLGG